MITSCRSAWARRGFFGRGVFASVLTVVLALYLLSLDSICSHDLTFFGAISWLLVTHGITAFVTVSAVACFCDSVWND